VKELESKYFVDEASFRKWISLHHDKCAGIWMVFYKKHTGRKCIKYSEALDTALCYGWIDSIIKKIDGTKYARKFTPRTGTSKWSEFNKKRVNELIDNGKMTETGLNKIESYLKTGKVNWVNNGTIKKNKELLHYPEFILKEFAKNEPALSNFNNLAPTYQRHYILWITDASRNVTIRNRIKESIGLLKENKKLGLK
jgi:uncharacterized protein YdeI (YjbR/CyaY-like superfamily)